MADAVGVLLLNWRHATATRAVLRQLDELECQTPLRVLVMDNGSGDDSPERLRDAVRDVAIDVELRCFDENLGYCAAMNRGLQWAAEHDLRWVLFLNNDVELAPRFLDPLVSVLATDPALAGVMPTVLLPDGSTWAQGGSVRFHANAVALNNEGRSPAPTDAGPETVDFLPGCCVLYDRASLDAVGGIDESYFMYVEDVDLGCRLRASGKKLLWLPWVRVVHLPSSSSGGGRSPLRKFMSGVNTVRFLRGHGGFREWAAFALFDVLLWPLTLVPGAGGFRAGWAKGRGILRGLFGGRVTERDVARWVPRSAAPVGVGGGK